MKTYTIFTTYVLVPTGGTFGMPYSMAIHCNYINKTQIETENINIHGFKLYFPNPDEFRFLNNTLNGVGYTANKIYILFQIVDNTNANGGEIIPISSEWRYVDVTNQIQNHGQYLSANDLTNTVFYIQFNNYDNYPIYNLNYLSYPQYNQSDKLSFGDETYFFGVVETEIKADVYTTDISINLPLNEFNTSTNSTWDGNSKVYISEIGIYDSDKNLVAIGKLNNPVPKDSTISRTIVFAIDF